MSELEYSRADLHELDAIMCGGKEFAASAPALCDLMSFAARQRAALVCAADYLAATGLNRELLGQIRLALGMRPTPEMLAPKQADDQ